MEKRSKYLYFSLLLTFISFIVVGIWGDSILAKTISGVLVVLGAYYFRKQ